MRKGTARSSSAAATTAPSFFTERTSTQISSGGTPSRDQPLGLGRHRLRLGALGAAAPEAHAGRRSAPVSSSVRADGSTARGGVEDPPAGAEVALEPDDLASGNSRGTRAGSSARRRGSGRSPGRRRPRSGRWCSSASSRSSMPCAKFVSWYSSTSTCRKRRGGPLAHVRALVEQAEGAQDEVAEVERAALGQQAVVVGVDAGELELARGCGRVPASVFMRQPPRPRRAARSADTISSLSRSMRDTKLRQQRRRVAADLVVAQRQLVDPLEQQREPVGGCDRREERVHARPRAPRPAAACTQKAWKVATCSSS